MADTSNPRDSSIDEGYNLDKMRRLTLLNGEEVQVRRASAKDFSRIPALNNLCFNNSHLSKNHAILRFYDNCFYLKDSYSTFGTIINDEFILPEKWFKVSDGDIVGFIVSKPSGYIGKTVEKFIDLGATTIALKEFFNAQISLRFKVRSDFNFISFELLPSSEDQNNMETFKHSDSVVNICEDIGQVEKEAKSNYEPPEDNSFEEEDEEDKEFEENKVGFVEEDEDEDEDENEDEDEEFEIEIEEFQEDQVEESTEEITEDSRSEYQDEYNDEYDNSDMDDDHFCARIASSVKHCSPAPKGSKYSEIVSAQNSGSNYSDANLGSTSKNELVFAKKSVEKSNISQKHPYSGDDIEETAAIGCTLSDFLSDSDSSNESSFLLDEINQFSEVDSDFVPNSDHKSFESEFESTSESESSSESDYSSDPDESSSIRHSLGHPERKLCDSPEELENDLLSSEVNNSKLFKQIFFSILPKTFIQEIYDKKLDNQIAKDDSKNVVRSCADKISIEEISNTSGISGKRKIGQLYEDSNDFSLGDLESEPSRKRVKVERSSRINEFLKELFKGALYALATVAALGVYGSTIAPN